MPVKIPSQDSGPPFKLLKTDEGISTKVFYFLQ
jgi:hypothetical protein